MTKDDLDERELAKFGFDVAVCRLDVMGAVGVQHHRNVGSPRNVARHIRCIRLCDQINVAVRDAELIELLLRTHAIAAPVRAKHGEGLRLSHVSRVGALTTGGRTRTEVEPRSYTDGMSDDAVAPPEMSDARPASERLPIGTITRYATGSIGTGGFATLPGLVLTYYLTDSLAVAALFAGVVLTVAKIWDVVIDPLIGALSDRELRLRGNRQRLMVIGAVSLPVLFALTFAAPPAAGPAVGGVWVLVCFMLAATAFSLFQVPYIALPAELTPSYDERTRLLSWRVVALTVAILLFGAGGPMIRRLVDDAYWSYLVMGIVAGAVIGLGMWISSAVALRARRVEAVANSESPIYTSMTEAPSESDAASDVRPRRGLRGIREQYAEGIRALRRSAPFRTLLATFVVQALATGLMLAGAQYVATWVLKDEAAIELLFIALIAPALLAAPLWGLFAKSVGKERAFRLASTIFAVASLSIMGALWAPGTWLYVPVGIAGLAYAGMQSLPMAMLPDVISHDERQHGPGRAGAFSGIWTAGETVGFALGATVLTTVLALSGYIVSRGGEHVVQPTGAVAGIIVSFSVVPAALIVLSLAALARYKLTRADIDAP